LFLSQPFQLARVAAHLGILQLSRYRLGAGADALKPRLQTGVEHQPGLLLCPAIKFANNSQNTIASGWSEQRLRPPGKTGKQQTASRFSAPTGCFQPIALQRDGPRIELLLLSELSAPAEPLHLAASVHDPLLPSEEWVADTAYLGVQRFLSGPSRKAVPTGAGDYGVVEVFGVDSFHDSVLEFTRRDQSSNACLELAGSSA
jgi:hypothetical protein